MEFYTTLCIYVKTKGSTAFRDPQVNQPGTPYQLHWVYYITSTRWEGVWHNVHTELVLEKLHQ